MYKVTLVDPDSAAYRLVCLEDQNAALLAERESLQSEIDVLAAALRTIRGAHAPCEWAYRVAESALEKHRAESAKGE